ncbi:hypothetical protein KC328_g116 [Hortaea werneckii]|nr:hypothetical protein KC328_g116 [Hortaea werneckii]
MRAGSRVFWSILFMLGDTLLLLGSFGIRNGGKFAPGSCLPSEEQERILATTFRFENKAALVYSRKRCFDTDLQTRSLPPKQTALRHMKVTIYKPLFRHCIDTLSNFITAYFRSVRKVVDLGKSNIEQAKPECVQMTPRKGGYKVLLLNTRCRIRLHSLAVLNATLIKKLSPELSKPGLIMVSGCSNSSSILLEAADSSCCWATASMSRLAEPGQNVGLQSRSSQLCIGCDCSSGNWLAGGRQSVAKPDGEKSAIPEADFAEVLEYVDGMADDTEAQAQKQTDGCRGRSLGLWLAVGHCIPVHR